MGIAQSIKKSNEFYGDDMGQIEIIPTHLVVIEAKKSVKLALLGKEETIENIFFKTHDNVRTHKDHGELVDTLLGLFKSENNEKPTLKEFPFIVKLARPDEEKVVEVITFKSPKKVFLIKSIVWTEKEGKLFANTNWSIQNDAGTVTPSITFRGIDDVIHTIQTQDTTVKEDVQKIHEALKELRSRQG